MLWTQPYSYVESLHSYEYVEYESTTIAIRSACALLFDPVTYELGVDNNENANPVTCVQFRNLMEDRAGREHPVGACTVVLNSFNFLTLYKFLQKSVSPRFASKDLQ